MTNSQKKFKVIKKTDLPNSELEIEVEISEELLSKNRKEVLKRMNENASISGFRKGHVPEKILIEKAGDMNILEDTAEASINEILPELFAQEKIEAIGRPNVSITKIALGNPLEFKLKISLMPKVELPDYKKIAVKSNSEKIAEPEVTEKEIDTLIEEIRKNFAKSTHDHAHETGEAHDHKETLPEWNDEFVKKLGDFKDIADFHVKVKKNLIEDKKRKEAEKKKLALAEEIIKASKINLPRILIDSELSKMEAQLEDDILRMGGNIPEYLKHIKKTMEDLKKDWEPDATKRAKLQLILNKIASEEKIFVPEMKVEEEVKHILDHYKEADPTQARIYVETVLTNEKVFQFLADQK
ncbi:MAG: trigger factor [Candidatus Paceibacterota bacterium]